MKNVFVVYADSNPNNVVAFFVVEADATAYQAARAGLEVAKASIDTVYTLWSGVTHTVGI